MSTPPTVLMGYGTPLYNAQTQATHAIGKSVGTLLAEADGRFHVAQHVVHVRVRDAAAALTDTAARKEELVLKVNLEL